MCAEAATWLDHFTMEGKRSWGAALLVAEVRCHRYPQNGIIELLQGYMSELGRYEVKKRMHPQPHR